MLVVAVACALAGGLVGALDRLSEALIGVSAGLIVIAQVAGVLHVPVLVAGWPAKLLVSLVVLTVAGWAVSTRSTRLAPEPGATHPDPSRATAQPVQAVVPVWAWVPAAVMVVLAAAHRILPPSQALRVYLTSGDSIVHTEYALRVLADGGITYDTDFYPVGWHALMAVAIGVSEQSGNLTPDLIVSALHAGSAATLLLFAMLAAALTRLGFLVAVSVGLKQRWLQGLVAAASGAAVLSTPSAMFVVRPSFQTLIYVGVAVAVALGCAVGRPSRFALATIAASAIAAAHGWALAVPAVVVAWCFVAWPLVRRGHVRDVVGTAVVAVVAGCWPIIASMTTVGLAHATMGGYHEPLAWPVLVAGLAAALALAVRARLTRRPWATWGVVAAVGLVTVLEAMVLSARLGISVLSYYPLKVLSIATLMVVPLNLALIGLGVQWVSGRTSVRSVGVLGTAMLVLLSWWGAQETISFSLGWREPNDVRDLLRPLYADGAQGANHAWQSAPEPYRDVYVRQLLDLYRPTDPARPPKREALPLQEECALMAQLPVPSVVTLDPDGATARYAGCGFPVRVIDVRTVSPSAIR